MGIVRKVLLGLENRAGSKWRLKENLDFNI
jgi:hypothetical protein